MKKTLEEKRKYHREYMRKKRAKERGISLLNRNRGLQDDSFNKYFAYFEHFVKKHYCIPTIRELMELSESKDNRTINKMLKELENRGWIIKKSGRFVFTHYGFRLYF